MSANQASDDPQSGADYARLPVPQDRGEAFLKIGRKQIPATVQETSIDGFTVVVTKKHAAKLRVGDTWVLNYDETILEVHPQWFFNSPSGDVQMGLRRLKDLTKPKTIGSWWAPSGKTMDTNTAGNSTLLFSGVVLVLFTAMALPGLGDSLGTSNRINDALKSIFQTVDRQITRVF
ncbi:MAG: hypothetical protein AAGA03_15840 [Planctomycetota bacterium]